MLCGFDSHPLRHIFQSNMNQQKGFIPIILAIIIIALLGFGAYFVVTQKIAPHEVLNPTPSPTPMACTQEAKQCPDDSYVGRTGPNCNFAECPIINPTPMPRLTPTPTPNQHEKQISLQEGQREASLLIQRIYGNYITGLNFREYPVATNIGQPVTLHIGESVSNGCNITLTLTSIDDIMCLGEGCKNVAHFTEKTDFTRPCPICLAEDTLIDTPSGAIAVQNLQKGMLVWTVDKFSNRILAKIIQTSKTPVPPSHQMVHIILSDKREIFASPGHPIGDGRFFNDLSVGEILNGSRITIAKKVSYDKGYTYDILPSGPTGFYFANGILIDSTLH